MSSYLTTAVRAVWSRLRIADDLSGYMAGRGGSWFDESEESKKALQIAKSDCPAVIMCPGVSGIAIAVCNNREFDVRLPLNFDLRVAEEAVDAAMDFYEMALRGLHAAWRLDNFGLDSSVGLWTTEPGAATVKKAYEAVENRLVFVSWQVEFLYTLVFRRVIES